MSVEEYLETVDNQGHGARLREIFDWMRRTFPSLEIQIKWKQPVFVEHGTFIIGFSTAREHMSVSPEAEAMERFSQEIREEGYSQTPNLFRIGWNQPVCYRLPADIIAFNRADKAECGTFWRK